MNKYEKSVSSILDIETLSIKVDSSYVAVVHKSGFIVHNYKLPNICLFSASLKKSKCVIESRIAIADMLERCKIKASNSVFSKSIGYVDGSLALNPAWIIVDSKSQKKADLSIIIALASIPEKARLFCSCSSGVIDTDLLKTIVAFRGSKYLLYGTVYYNLDDCSPVLDIELAAKLNAKVGLSKYD